MMRSLHIYIIAIYIRIKNTKGTISTVNNKITIINKHTLPRIIAKPPPRVPVRNKCVRVVGKTSGLGRCGASLGAATHTGHRA